MSARCTTPPYDAVMVAATGVVIVLEAVTVKFAELAFLLTFTVAGTVTPETLLLRVTVIPPPVVTVLLMYTVAVWLVPEVIGLFACSRLA